MSDNAHCAAVEALLKTAEEVGCSTVTFRRDLHKHAEVAWTEFRTGSLVARQLMNLGWDVKYGPELYDKSLMFGMPSAAELDAHADRAIAQGGDKEIIDRMRGGYTGVLATLKVGDGNGPVVGFRVDIDANDLQEAQDEKHRPFSEGWSSVNANMDHACGHDCHTAIGVAAAKTIYENRHLFPSGTIKIVFQTGEEGGRGGRPMAATGIMDDCDYFMAIHMADGGVGKIIAGVSQMSNSIKSDVYFKGVPAHAGGAPQHGKNALLAAANAAVNLYAISRHSGGNTRVNVGVLEAGVGRNVIAPNAYMKMEVRGETAEIMEYMNNRALAVIEGSAKMYDAEWKVVETGQTISAPMSKEMVDIVVESSGQIPEVTEVIRNASMAGGGEDCTFFMLRVQKNGGVATMANIGTTQTAVNHNGYFDIDEKALVTGTQLIALVALNSLKRGKVR